MNLFVRRISWYHVIVLKSTVSAFENFWGGTHTDRGELSDVEHVCEHTGRYRCGFRGTRDGLLLRSNTLVGSVAMKWMGGRTPSQGTQGIQGGFVEGHEHLGARRMNVR